MPVEAPVTRAVRVDLSVMQAGSNIGSVFIRLRHAPPQITHIQYPSFRRMPSAKVGTSARLHYSPTRLRSRARHRWTAEKRRRLFSQAVHSFDGSPEHATDRPRPIRPLRDRDGGRPEGSPSPLWQSQRNASAVSHGNGFAVDAYVPFWQQFLRDYDVVVFDFRNHGQSDRSGVESHVYAQLARDLDRSPTASRPSSADARRSP